jgi:hypothetical protein
MLSKNIEKQEEGAKIIFIDELPWLDTQKSRFFGALEHFWNNWAYYRKDIKLIVCGSATSWMLNKLIGKNYWLQKIGTPEYAAWSGYSFETVCLHHIEQIVNALGISGTFYSPCSWAYLSKGSVHLGRSHPPRSLFQ